MKTIIEFGVQATFPKVRTHYRAHLLYRAILYTALVLSCLNAVSPAQAQILWYDEYQNLGVISLGSLDAEISRAKLEATKAQEPALEFEMVKLSIKDYVDRNRVSDYQTVTFATPDRFRSWLQEAARRAERPYDELLQEVIDAVAPNPVPDLTGDIHDYNDTYIRDRAMENVQRNQGPPDDPAQEFSSEINNYGEPDLRDRAMDNVRTQGGTSYRHAGDIDVSLLESSSDEEMPAGTKPIKNPVYTRPPGDPALIKIEFSDTKTTVAAAKKKVPAAAKKSR